MKDDGRVEATTVDPVFVDPFGKAVAVWAGVTAARVATAGAPTEVTLTESQILGRRYL